MTTRVSIIICTSNRAEHLRQTLESLAGVTVPAELPTEVVVVDNASTDGTAKLIQGFHLPNMRLRYLYEGRRGQCYARNCGIAASEAQIIIFTDDDLRFSPDWLQNLCRPIQAGEAEAVLGSITIAPDLERPWMGAGHRTKLASTEYVNPESEFRLVGANMAFSRSVLAKVPSFDVELGPGALGFVDDSLFSRQLRAAGYRLTYVPEAAVVHHFDPARLTRASFESRSIKQGQSAAYVAHHWEHRPSSPAFQVQRHLLRQWLRLLYWRARQRERFSGPEGMPQWEMEILHDIAFDRQILIEQRRPRNYEKCGLTKQHGLKTG